jgi:hypothetical protein
MQHETLVKKKMKSSEKFGGGRKKLLLDFCRLWNKIELSLQEFPPTGLIVSLHKGQRF